ncbi:MAG: RIP metalloprotease RseP [Deltaproteobacteria bacterium]|jgi:regulator of sigma E protease|nr:RIP metalloprotease RseP [Deltaproteobacteria bacterium]
MLLTLVSFIVLLLILIFVHELGHFLAAKLLGVRVEKFSLGFPPKLYSRKIGETVYQICWLPLGGYVSLLGELPGATISEEDKKVSFSHKPVWVRIAISFAGPFFNLVFAFLALWLLIAVVGFHHLPPVVGRLVPDGPAQVAGLQPGDLVLAIDGQEIKYFDEITEFPEKTGGAPMSLSINRSGQTLSLKLNPESKERQDILGSTERYWSLGLMPSSSPRIGQVLDGRPAQLAGIRDGDLVTAIDGKPIDDWSQIVETVQGPEESRATETGTPVKPMIFEVLRDGQTLSFTVTPKLEPNQTIEGKTLYTAMIGVNNKPDVLVEKVGIFRAFGHGFIESCAIVKLTYMTLAKLIQTKISPKIMGGPILIAEAAGSKIREGLADFIALMAMISVNLAVINLVPLPILDGGQILFFLIEGIRRKPLSLRFKEISQTVGIFALLALMVLVFYNDISRIVTRKVGPPAVVQETVTD